MNWQLFFARIFGRPVEGAPTLIVNADDFGMSRAVNRGIVRAHERGIVTSASLMVRREAAGDAGEYARRARRLGVGLHVDLGEWVRVDGEWQTVYSVVDLTDRAAIEAEIGRQLETFRDVVGRDPTHLDSHQHVHMDEPVRAVMIATAGRLQVPLRHFTAAVRYCGQFYGLERDGEWDERAVSVEALLDLVANLPAGTTELCCHPGESEPGGDQYSPGRPKELAALCDRRVTRALADRGISLQSFRGVAPALSFA